MIIGLDDTDSKESMCTTYLAAVLIEKLKKYGMVKGYPILIRLNPNIKYKTRGNAALAIPVELNENDDADEVKRIVIEAVENMAILSEENTNPGVVFIEETCEAMEKDLAVFSIRTVQDILEINEAEELLARYEISHRGFKNKRGLIGALAAAGFALTGLPDFTYELITYREKKRWGTPREIDENTVWQAGLTPDTWDTVDHENRRIVFAPHSPDPILFGIRGRDENAVRCAFSLIKSEPIERFVVYKTNQNTDMHLLHAKISDVLDDRSYVLSGKVSRSPETIVGGHIIFEIMDDGGALECAAFEPTKGFRSIIRQLIVADDVTVYGSVKNRTMNLEKIKINILSMQELRNPICCGKRMKSAGRGQGYRCEKCGAIKKEKVIEIISRKLSTGFYEVPPSARRHLAKPLVRYHMTAQASSYVH